MEAKVGYNLYIWLLWYLIYDLGIRDEGSGQLTVINYYLWFISFHSPYYIRLLILQYYKL